jgi:hypothetical protein
MKIIFFFIMSIIPISLFSQSINSFWDIPWGTSEEICKKIMLEKNCVYISSNIDEYEKLVNYVYEGRYSNEQAKISISFYNGKICLGEINFVQTTVEVYWKIKNELAKKYGESNNMLNRDDIDEKSNFWFLPGGMIILLWEKNNPNGLGLDLIIGDLTQRH